MFDILNLRRIDDLTWAVNELTRTVKVLCLVFTGGTWEDLEKEYRVSPKLKEKDEGKLVLEDDGESSSPITDPE